MRWDLGQRSSYVEDRRGLGVPVISGGIGVLLIAGIVYLLGGDPSVILQDAQPQQAQTGAPPGQRADDRDADFSRAVLGQTEQVWSEVFRERGRTYEAPTLVLYDDATETGCGIGLAATGPFYCPQDGKLYLDLSFLRQMRERLGAPGDFAEAYVIAHEVGHHVQDLLGQMREAPGRGAEGASVRTELQADCYAGVWANRANAKFKNLEEGDVDEGLGAAAAVGDDRIQQQRQGYVTPDSFTHGTSAQRSNWFRRGFSSGRMEDCDTFGAASL